MHIIYIRSSTIFPNPSSTTHFSYNPTRQAELLSFHARCQLLSTPHLTQFTHHTEDSPWTRSNPFCCTLAGVGHYRLRTQDAVSPMLSGENATESYEINNLFLNTIFVSSHMYSENPGETQVIVGSINIRYISDTARNKTHTLFRPKREPIPLGHSGGQSILFISSGSIFNIYNHLYLIYY